MRIFKKLKNRYLDIYLTSSRGNIGQSIRISFIQIILIGLAVLVIFIFLIVNLSNNNAYIYIDDYIKSKRLSDSLEISLINPIGEEQYFVSKAIGKEHKGVDISIKLRSEIVAPSDAVVLYVGNDSTYGNSIILSHKNNFYTFYGHLDTIFVKSHQFIKIGELLGLVGETGNASGPHLHFEIWDELGALDPRKIITEFKERDVTQ